jgi:hypothetical protein
MRSLYLTSAVSQRRAQEVHAISVFVNVPLVTEFGREHQPCIYHQKAA